MSEEQKTIDATTASIDTEAIAQSISDELKTHEASFRCPTNFFDALTMRRSLATLADRAELLYRAARAEATLWVAKLPKDDPQAKNEETRKAAVDLMTVLHKTLVARATVLSEQALFAVRYYLGNADAGDATAREAA